MEHNPYTPPASKESAVLHEAAPRPIAVWLLLGVFSIFFAIFAVRALQFLGDVLSHWRQMPNAGFVAIAAAWQLFLIAVSAAFVVGIYRRRA